jgi:hypothetical protein
MEQIAYLLAQPFVLAAETWDIVDDTSTRSVALPAGTYRVFLGHPSTHSASIPGDLLAHLEAALGSLWTVRLGADALVRISYLGTSPATLTPPPSSPVPSILGQPLFSGSWAADETRVASYLPTHCVFAAVVDPDTGWQVTPGRFNGARLPRGVVYGWGDRLQSRTRQVTLKYLPKDALAREAILVSEAGTAPGTPAIGPLDRWYDAWATDPAQSPPWGAMETIATAGAQACGWTDDLQRLIAGLWLAFDVVYVTPESLRETKVVLSVEHYDLRRDITGLELSYAGAGSRS